MQCPAHRASTGPGRLLALLSGWPRSTRDIACARRLAKIRPDSCHFGNYFR
jgi:hypothetical protein